MERPERQFLHRLAENLDDVKMLTELGGADRAYLRAAGGRLAWVGEMNRAMHAPATDRVRANTWVPVNDRLDTEAQMRMREAAASASTDELTRRITQLDYEWEFDRTLETEASVVGLLGLMLGIAVDKRFLVLPAFVSTMLVLHATHGWYPLLPLFRRIGVRTHDEIDRERYGLKALRGDFTLPPAGAPAAERAAAAWKAVCE
jgi:hypothetical protein